jgi:hypothetical protein
MGTVQVEVLLKEAMEEEKKEVERIRKKYRERIKELQNQKDTKNIDQEKQALIEQAQLKEQQEKEQLRQKYKQRQKQNTTQPTTNPENEDPHDEVVVIKELPENEKIITENENISLENKQINQLFEENGFDQEADNENSLLKHPDEIYNHIQSSYEENEELETVDRTELLEKYNIKDVHDDEIDYILESFDNPLIEENIEKIEETLMENIKRSALSHPKIEWVNVLVFLDDKELEGSIKIFADYVDRSLLKHIISKNNEKLELDLIQIALYEVWDVFTTLGVNIDNLESKIDVEVELDQA